MNTNVPSTWWSRHWKWVVPALAALMLAAFAVFIGGLMTLVFGMMRSSEPYRHALERAQRDSAVIAALGEPIQAGWLVQGSFSGDGSSGSGHADLSIPLDGTRAEGTLYVVAKKHAGEWRYETLAVNVDGGERIVLEPPSPRPATDSP